MVIIEGMSSIRDMKTFQYNEGKNHECISGIIGYDDYMDNWNYRPCRLESWLEPDSDIFW